MNTIKNILIPTDFSEASINSIKYGIELARQLNAKLFILNVFHVEIPSSDAALFPGSETFRYLDTMNASLMKVAEEKFKEIERELFISNIPQREFICVPGFVEDRILDFTRENNIDLVIMASTHPNKALEFFGSHITHLINKLEKPILVVPAEAKYRKIKDILLASDFGEVTEKIKILIEFAQIDKAEVQIFNNETGYEDEAIDFIGTASTLNHILKFIPHKYHKAYFEDVEEGIINYIKSHKVDLLTVIPRHHNLFQNIFRKSVSKNMAFHSTIPLLIIPE